MVGYRKASVELLRLVSTAQDKIFVFATPLRWMELSKADEEIISASQSLIDKL